MPGEFSEELASPEVRVDEASLLAARQRNRVRALKGLLWCEWFAHSKLLLSFLVLWLLCAWVVPIFFHPFWILLFGVAYALIAGPAYGGGDVIEGCEEFSFSLPATRAERYLTRLVVGGGALFLFTLLDLMALGLDLGQVLARLYINTGLIKPAPVLKPGLLYGLVFAVPFAVFSFSFALSAVARSRGLVFTAWFWSSLAALILLHWGFRYEDFAWNETNGYFSFPLLILIGTIGLWCGFRVYLRKEVAPQSAPLLLPARWWLWAILFILGIGLTVVLLMSLARLYPRFFASAG
ncbi:MAG: hypothetical protein ACYDH9_02200 [Limisphaerales bacterium]